EGMRGQETSWTERALHFDWVLILSAVGTTVVGVLMVHSAEAGLGTSFLTRQVAGAVLGLLGLLFLALLPYQVFRMYVKPLYGFMIFLLEAVLIPGLGTNLRGTRGCFHLGPIYLQASEAAKLLFVLTLGGV